MVLLFAPHPDLTIGLGPFYAPATGKALQAACQLAPYGGAIHYSYTGRWVGGANKPGNQVEHAGTDLFGRVVRLGGRQPIRTMIGAFLPVAAIGGFVGGAPLRREAAGPGPT